MSDSKKIKSSLEELFNVKINNVASTIKDIEKSFEKKDDSKLNKKNLDFHTENDNSYLDNITNDIKEISLDKIIPNPYQPRKFFNMEKLQELADSIKSHGLFTPILLKQYSSGYYIISGERRYRASKLNNFKFINAIILPISDNQMQEIALLENIQREDLSQLEEAKAFKSIIDRRNLTHEQIAKIISKSRSYVTSSLSLLKLPIIIQNYLLDGKLSMGHIKPLMSLNNTELMIKIASRAIEEKLSVRDVELIAKGYKLHMLPKKRNPICSENKYLEVVDKLKEYLHSKIIIKNKTLFIKFRDDKHLNRILSKFKDVDLLW